MSSSEDGAPAELAAAADSTFGTYDLYAYVITYMGAQVETCTKRVGDELRAKAQCTPR